MQQPLLEDLVNKRVIVENPQNLFAAIKQSQKYVSWANLVEISGCSNTALKYCRRGKRTFDGKVFLNLLNFLSAEQQQEILPKLKLVNPNWGASKGGKTFVRNKKEQLGEEGFLNYLNVVREKFGGLSNWHKKMKKEFPTEYSAIQRKRWLKRMAILRTDKDNIRKRVNSLKKRFGGNYFSLLGLKTASLQNPTPREKEILNNLQKSGFEIDLHKTISKSNYDFIYKKNGVVLGAEEVLGFKKKKSQLFYDILVIYEKYKYFRQQFDLPFFISSWYKVDLGYKRERIPIDLMLWVFDNGLMPILTDIELFSEVRRDSFAGNNGVREKIHSFLQDNLIQRKLLLERGAVSQLRQKFDEVELEVHEFLKSKGINAVGKKLFQTKYGTFTVADNYFEIGESKFAVFVSKNDLKGIIGSSAIIKELVSPKIKTIGILTEMNKRNFKTKAQITLLKSYVDYFYNSLEDFSGLVV